MSSYVSFIILRVHLKFSILFHSYFLPDLEIQDIALSLVFGIGYAGIIFEESLALNKSGIGLLMAVSLWVIRSIGVWSIIFVSCLLVSS